MIGAFVSLAMLTAATDAAVTNPPRNVPSGEWAACIAATAPAEAKLWRELGRPGKVKDSALAARSANLAFRLKVACAGRFGVTDNVGDVRFDARGVWDKLAGAAPAGTAAPALDLRAASCAVAFIADDVSAYLDRPQALPADVAGRAVMQIDLHEALAPGDPTTRLTKVTQGDGRLVYLLHKCRLITADGTLADA